MGQLTGKVAIITGASGGIGMATARRFAAEGATLMLTDITGAAQDDLPEALFCHHDVTDEDAWAAVITQTLTRFGRLDVLVNNAGIFKTAPLGETSVAMFRQTVEINQLGVFLGIRAAAPAMSGTGGSIINLSSVAGLFGSVNTIAYTGSKWAVRGMTKTAALELAPFKIRVNSVHPGGVDTAMLDGPLDAAGRAAVAANTPLKRLATADDIAAMNLFLASDSSAYSTGSEFICDGGMTMG